MQAGTILYYIILIPTIVLLSTHELNESLQPRFNKTFVSLLPYHFSYPKYVLRLLKFFFIKRTLYFLSVVISYFIYHWNRQLNFRNCKNLFRPSLSVSFIKIFFFFVILTWSQIENFGVKVLTQNYEYKFLHFIFVFRTTCFLQSHFYWWMNCIIVLIYK